MNRPDMTHLISGRLFLFRSVLTATMVISVLADESLSLQPLYHLTAPCLSRGLARLRHQFVGAFAVAIHVQFGIGADAAKGWMP